MPPRPRSLAVVVALAAFGLAGCSASPEPARRPEAPEPPSAEQQARASCVAPPASGPRDEIARYADETASRIERHAADVRRKLERARRDRDVVAANCQNGKLSQLDRALVRAREHVAALKAAADDQAEVSKQTSALGALCVRAEIVAAESTDCLGG